MATLNWGILGTGNIARQFAEGMATARRSVKRAVGSRDPEHARHFAGQYGFAAAYGSYEQVLADPAVAAVYVALPNHLHRPWTLAALAAGKHVLCEKPLAVSAAEAQEMFAAAERAGRLLVEAFMYRCHPQTRAVLDQVRAGSIGKLRLIRTSFCFRIAKPEGNVRFDPAMAGGSLMDVGCYCINFSRLLAGAEPSAMHAVGHLHPGGVDDYAAGTLVFPGGELLASFTCGMTVHASNTAWVCGDQGYLEIPVPWKPPVQKASFTLARCTPPRIDGAAAATPAPPRQSFEVDAPQSLYGMEADAFAAAVLDDAPPHVSPQDTLGNMRVLDELRRQIGVRG
jgi:predicted dehydrogenase